MTTREHGVGFTDWLTDRPTDQLTDWKTDRQTDRKKERKKDRPEVLTQAQLLGRERSFSAFVPNSNDVWAVTNKQNISTNIYMYTAQKPKQNAYNTNITLLLKLLNFQCTFRHGNWASLLASTDNLSGIKTRKARLIEGGG